MNYKRTARPAGAVGLTALMAGLMLAGTGGPAAAAETPPTGTGADWAWTADWADEVGSSYADYTLKGLELVDGSPTNYGWKDSSACWHEDTAVGSTSPSSRVADWWGSTYYAYPDAPKTYGALDPVDSQDPTWAHFVNAAGPESDVTLAMPAFTKKIVVDIAAGCPSLNLTGDIYIQGADIETGRYTFSDAPGAQGNHLGEHYNGGAGTVTSADVSARPIGDGKIEITFAKAPVFGEWMSGAVRAHALTEDGRQVRVTAGYSYLGYGGQPTARDLVREVAPGDTVTITEAELRESADFYSNIDTEIDVTGLPADVVESEVDGQRAFTYTAVAAGDTVGFKFAAAEAQSPAGRVVSAPADATIRVLDEPVVVAPEGPMTPVVEVPESDVPAGDGPEPFEAHTDVEGGRFSTLDLAAWLATAAGAVLLAAGAVLGIRGARAAKAARKQG